jgi:uncharacterized protein (DUF2141 family)
MSLLRFPLLSSLSLCGSLFVALAALLLPAREASQTHRFGCVCAAVQGVKQRQGHLCLRVRSGCEKTNGKEHSWADGRGMSHGPTLLLSLVLLSACVFFV